MGKKEVDITTAQGRKKLEPRREPYWRREGAGHIGFRCTSPGGEGTWLGRLMQAEGYTFKPLGRFADFRDAVAQFKSWSDDLAAANTAGVGAKALNLTVADAATHYLEHSFETRVNKEAHQKLQRCVELLIIGREGKSAKPANPIAKVKLTELTKRDVLAFRKGLLKGHTEADAPRPIKSSASKYLKIFVAVLNKAHEDSLVASKAAWESVPGFTNHIAKNDESHRYLTRKERAKILAALSGEYRLFAEMLCNLGARPIEIGRLVVGDYNKKTGELRLWNFKGTRKEERERIVPVSVMPPVLATLAVLCKDKLPGAPMFKLNKDTLLRGVNDCILEIGVKDATAYSFRHSFITDCLTNGIMIHEVARISGTSMEMIEQTYGKLLTDNIEKVFKELRFA